MQSAVQLAFAPSGATLATSVLKFISQWAVATGKRLPASARPAYQVSDLCFTHDGKRLTGTADSIYTWDTSTGQESGHVALTPQFRRAIKCFSPDKTWVVTSDEDGKTLTVRDVATKVKLHSLKGHESRVDQVAFCPDGRRLCSTDQNHAIRVWDLESCLALHELTENFGRVYPLAVSPNGLMLASGACGGGGELADVCLWDLQSGHLVHRFAVGGQMVWDLAFSPDSRLVAAAFGNFFSSDPEPGQVGIWDVTTGIERLRLRRAEGDFLRLVFSPDGRMLATGATDACACLWELVTGRRRRVFNGHENYVEGIAFSPDGRLLASASDEAPVYVWDLWPERIAARRLSADELRRCWSDLALADAAAAYAAVQRLAMAPEQAVPLLRERLKPVAADHMQRLLASLDSASFTQRQEAAAELERLAPLAAEWLRRALKETPSAEVRSRLGEILKHEEARTPAMLRTIRAVEALEWAVTPEALHLLDTLAAGAEGALLTREAARARERLRKRSG
jgi:hypothetical protein